MTGNQNSVNSGIDFEIESIMDEHFIVRFWLLFEEGGIEVTADGVKEGIITVNQGKMAIAQGCNSDVELPTDKSKAELLAEYIEGLIERNIHPIGI